MTHAIDITGNFLCFFGITLMVANGIYRYKLDKREEKLEEAEYSLKQRTYSLKETEKRLMEKKDES